MVRSLFLLVALLSLPVILSAHLGNSEVVMQGRAGPYNVLININPPQAIPGIAKVKVYVQTAGAHLLTLRPVYFRTGDEGAPEADKMQAVSQQPAQYTGETWLMKGGSASIQIRIAGAPGIGEILVPVMALSTATKSLPAFTGTLLLALGLLLFLLIITIVGATVGDAVTATGEPVPENRERSRMLAMMLAFVTIMLLLYGGYKWWDSWASDYKQYLFQPTQAKSIVKQSDGVNELQFFLDTSEAAQRSSLYPYIVPDHGKMMHLFVVRLPNMDAFAHLHPRRNGIADYRTLLAGLPKGKYMAFADIVYISGFSETIADTFDISNESLEAVPLKTDPDDAIAFAVPPAYLPPGDIPANTIVCGSGSNGVKLKDGSTMYWEGPDNAPLDAGKLYNLQFSVLGPGGQPATLQPYMGMNGHAAIIRNDGQVYMHLHPGGTLSMAAEENFQKRMDDEAGEYSYPEPLAFKDSIDRYMRHLTGLSDSAREATLTGSKLMEAMHNQKGAAMAHDNMLTLPCSFPSAGQYRIWVQVKREGQVLTAAFDRIVK